MRSIPPSSSATRATTATAFATTWRSEASNPSSRRDRTVRRQSNTIGKPTSGATSSSDASIASSNSGSSPPDTRKPPELTFRCYASQQRNSGSKPSTRPRLSISRRSGRPTPDMYSPDLSLFVLDAGIRLLETHRADVLYLSLSDMVQHSAGPGEELADSFNREVDRRVGRMLELGALVAIVADHGMTDKCTPDGQPQVVYLEKALNDQFGPGSVRVICPITDPFVKHHGALGSFVRVYATGSVPAQTLIDAAARIPGVALVLDGESAAARYEMPQEREGDFIAVADTYTAIGSRPDEHDLAGLTGHRLRSHGGLSEQPVPFMLSCPLNETYRAIAQDRRLRNFDIFDFALNGTV